jgi:Ca-activated chloride channel family protein
MSPPIARPSLAALALAASLVATAQEGAAPLAVRLVSPLADDVLDGVATIEAAVDRRGDVGVMKVDFYVDGERVGWRDEPPYRIEWDAGDSLRARQIRAVAYGTDGRTYEGVVRTRELRVDYRERVSVVNVFATVRDFGGDYAGNLEAGDFRISEDGVPQAISHFAYEDLPLHVVITLDVSLTMRGERIATAREAAERFANSLHFGRDRAAVVTFAGKPDLAVPLTAESGPVLAAIQASKETPGGTALYDAIVLAVETLRGIEGRKAVIVLSDGRDESGDGFRPGSLHSYEEALEVALKSEAIFYPIGVGREIEGQKDFYGVRTVGAILRAFADQTGGQTYFATRVGQLRRAYENVAEALRHQYNLGYTPSNLQRDGTWREIRVVVDREGYEVNARKGYYAPSR